MCSTECLPAKVLGKLISALIQKHQYKLDVSKVIEKVSKYLRTPRL